MSKLDGIKAGDRVRVTFEGVVDQMYPHSFTARFDGYEGVRGFAPKEIEVPSFEITLLKTDFKVGDRVAVRGQSTSPIYDVIAILSDGRLVFEFQAGDTTGVMARDPSCFARA